MNTPKPIQEPDILSRPLVELRGVGPERSAQLARLGLHCVRDLLLHRPRRYEDRRQVQSISQLQIREIGTTRGRIVALGVKRYARGRKSVFEIILEDGSGRLHCRWWNLPYMQNYFQQGDEVLVHGKLLSLKPRTMDHPETEVIDEDPEVSIHLNRIVPVYPLTEGLPQRWLRSLISRTLQEYGASLPEPPYSHLVPEFFPRTRAIEALHFPAESDDANQARRRLALDELIGLQLTLLKRRQALHKNARGRPCPGDNRLIKPFLAGLGFRLTNGQTQVLRELRRDMSSGPPMRRLLQGDVGSGKTVVAGCCALLTIESGFSVALMAPTEILAEQHFQTFTRWLKPLGLEVHLQTGSRKTLQPFNPGPVPDARTSTNPDLIPAVSTTGTNPIKPVLVIGTHALLEGSFSLDNLGLVIIDEQHRFGVLQREELVRKGQYPHLLLMTATPIPRTLGLTLYGDLDVSVINELPAGRAPIRTFVRTAQSLAKVWAFVRAKLSEGRQVFVVFPRVEDTAQELKAVTQEFDAVQKELAPSKAGLLHGRLGIEERQRVMEAFRANSLQVLLSTSLIEVGIDVPNATVMLIENAEQFGLAQLHQLRGRIGRGAHESYCILITHARTAEARKRLQTLSETTDGFRIAEEDLIQRGPGELLGQQQSGLPPFAFADLSRDLPLVERARNVAQNLLNCPP